MTTSPAFRTAVLLLGILLAGCTSPSPHTTGTDRTLAAQAAPEAEGSRPVPSTPAPLLANSRWRLVEFQSMDDAQGTMRPAASSVYTMHLQADGTASMRLDCNRATATWSATPGGEESNGSFTFGPVAATRAICPPPNLDEKIVAHAEYVRGYLQKDDRLYLTLMADGGIYVWERDKSGTPAAMVPAAPEDGGPRTWEVTGKSQDVTLREQPSTMAPPLASYPPGTILVNLGCQVAGGEAWCDVQPFGGGPRGYVPAAFLAPAVSPDGSVAMGPDDSAVRAGQGDFDATGTLPCAQYRGQPMTGCSFGVARAGGGYATLVITRPDGRTRAIFFSMGVPIGADTSQADGYHEMTATREADLHHIRIGDERYEIPEAVVWGG